MQPLRHAIFRIRGFELAPRLHKRHDDNVDVAKLVLERVASSTVKEGRDSELKFPL